MIPRLPNKQSHRRRQRLWIGKHRDPLTGTDGVSRSESKICSGDRLEKGIAPAAQIRSLHRQFLARHDLQRLAPQ